MTVAKLWGEKPLARKLRIAVTVWLYCRPGGLPDPLLARLSGCRAEVPSTESGSKGGL
jgi:hypothetical protein